MSIAVMKKLDVIAPAQDADSLIRRLMHLRCVQINTMDLSAQQLAARYGDAADLAQAQKRVQEIEEALPVMQKYAPRQKRGAVRCVDRQAFRADGSYEHAWASVHALAAATARLSACKKEIEQTETLLSTLAPWRQYNVMLGKRKTAATVILLGSFPAQVSPEEVADALSPYLAYAETVTRDDRALYMSVICHRSETDAVSGVLSEMDFVPMPLGEVREPAKKAYAAAEEKLGALREEADGLRRQIESCGTGLGEVRILYDVEKTEERVAENLQKLAATEHCVVLTGWVPADRVQKVEDRLLSMDCAYETSDPEPEDDVPVQLRNNAFASNFEWVLGMYSYPKYGSYDPTMVMSIFYMLIFGLMFADVGYGLVLVLVGLIVPKITHMRGTMKRMFNMFGYCGFPSMLFGVLFGGWFGNMPYSVMTWLGIESPETVAPLFNGLRIGNVLLNMTENPLLFIGIALGAGAVHLLAGLAIKFVLLCRQGKVADAFFDVFSWWMIFAGIGLLFVNTAVGAAVGGIGVLIVICTAGRDTRNPVLRFFKGLLGLYGLINYASDLLSYSRIMALALAGTVIGQVFNMVGTMVPGVGGFLMMVLVFLIGHGLNLAINTLGAFVHTSRLQYIEFFGKFFEDGGTQFVPEEPSEKYSLDAADTAGAETSDPVKTKQ